MRILLAPVLDLPREDAWQGDSCYLWSRFVAQAASERGWHTTWVLPEVYQPPALPRVSVVKYAIPPDVPKTNLYLRHQVPANVMQRFPGPQGPGLVDAVVTNDVWLGTLYQQYFSARQFLEGVPVVSWNGYPTILGWAETDWVFGGDETPLYARALGHALCTYVACCPYCNGRATELVRAFCAPQMVQRFLQTHGEVMMCADCPFLDGLDEPKNERFSLYWGGRFTATKGGEESIKQYLRMLMGGRDIDIYVTAVGGAKRLQDLLKKYGAKDAIHLSENLPYEQAQRVMKRSHASVFWQLNPGAAAPYEQMYAGLVVLFKKHNYPEEAQMYPPDYPFMFKDEAECGAMLRWVYENYEAAQAKLAACKTREWVYEHTDKLLGANRILDIAERRVREAVPTHGPGYKWYDDTLQMVDKALSACEPPVTLSALCDALNKMKGRQIVQQQWGAGMQGLLPFTIYRTFIPPGWRDDCEEAEPRFVRA